MIFDLVLVLIIIFLFFVLSMIWPPDSPWAPWWRTNKKIAKAACEIAKINSKDIVYELGSGDATFLLTAVKEYGARGVGIEIDPLRVFISRIRIFFNQLSDRTQIVQEDLYKQDFSKATVIFVYLVPKALNKLKPKFLKELRPGTKIISLRYKIDLFLIKEDRINNLYVYRIK